MVVEGDEEGRKEGDGRRVSSLLLSCFDHVQLHGKCNYIEVVELLGNVYI